LRLAAAHPERGSGALASDPDTAVGFDGGSGWVSVPAASSLNVGDRFSIEGWVKRGVPAVVSIAWNNKSKNQRLHLDGADIKSTGGHLIVVRGFTGMGDVIANDPASRDNAAVRHVYRRDQFEFLWLHASAGVVYLIKPYRIAGKAGANG